MSEPTDNWLKRLWALMLETSQHFSDDGVPRLAAAMSYFLLLALAPTLLILNAIVGLVGARLGQSQPTPVLSTGSDIAAAGFAQAVSWAGSYAPYVAAVLVVVGAVSVFGQFVAALELIWKIPPSPTPIRAFVRSHALSLGLLGVAALALLGAIVVASLIAIFAAIALGFAEQLGVAVPEIALSVLVRSVLVFLSAAVLFSVAFTVAPSRGTKLRDVVPGALVTAALFLVGETGLSYYLGTTQRFNVFGAFQFFVVLVVWIYYSALVALWGAELTRLLVLAAEGRRSADTSGGATGVRT